MASSRAHHIIEHLAEDTVKHAIQACRAHALNRPAPLERIYHDPSIYARHENDDHRLAMLGKGIPGLPYDASFYRTSCRQATRIIETWVPAPLFLTAVGP